MEKKDLTGFRMFRQESYPEMLRRLIREQVEHSVECCGQQESDPDTAVHEIRKSTKRIRAVYRLFRSVADPATFQSAADKYSGISQQLAPLRLSAVYLETLDRLVVDKKSPVPPTALKKLRNSLSRNHEKLIKRQIHGDRVLSHVHDLLRQEISISDSLIPETIEFRIIAENMQQTYGRGIKNLEMVLQNPVNENLHNLRKSVKYLWNQFIILRPLWPPVMGTSIRHLDLLAEKLGFDHDLAELEQFLLNNPSLNHGKGAEQLLHGIRTKRRQIQKTTIPLARRIFSERPGAVRDRLTAYEQVFR